MVLYVLMLATPTAVFLFIGIGALSRQSTNLVEKLDGGDFQVRGRRVVIDIEDRTAALTAAFFDDPAVAGLRRDLAATRRVGCPDIRASLEQAATRHRIVAQTFVICDGLVQFPLVRAPAPITDAKYIASHERNATTVLALLSHGDLRRAQKRLTEALSDYSRGYDSSESAEARALLLVRMVRCLRAMKLPQAADTVRKVLSQYGDVYGPTGIPYGIDAALQLPGASEELAQVRSELLKGRWSDISADQASLLLRNLELRLGALPPAAPTPFLQRINTAKALQAVVKDRHRLFENPVSPLGKNKRSSHQGVFSLAFRNSQDTSQAFFTIYRGSRSGEVLSGFTADLDWLQRTVLPDYLGYNFDITYKGSAAPDSLRLAFDRIFPQWEIVPASPMTQKRAVMQDIFVFTGSVVLLGLMVVGFIIIMRHFAHERHMARMRTDFITGASHELKTPISIIRLYAETLVEDDSTGPEARDHCQLICEEAERLTHLVDGILDFSPVDRGMKQYALVRGDLTSVVRPALHVCQAYLQRKGMNLALDLCPSLPETCFDSEAVKSAIINLVDNAVKYSGMSNTIEVKSYHDEEYVFIVVTDHGIGIARREQQKIFEPYYRVDTGFSRGGCGLGLFLVKHLMEVHGGKVDVTSEVGAGSCFRLMFPISAKRTESAEISARFATA